MPSLAAVTVTSLLSLLGLDPKTPTPPPPAAPAAAIVQAPSSAAKGTMIMIHGGGWLGPGPKSQQHLIEQPGDMLVQRGWRVVSLDYHAGTDGISDVLNAAGQELLNAPGTPLCLYGESAGAQIALIVAARLKAVDCVIAAGAPTDFQAYKAEANASGDSLRKIIAGQIENVFGTSEDVTAPWEPVRVSKQITSDVLMLREADDQLMPREQLDRFLAARPTTESVELESNPLATPDSWWLHGTLSDAGRATYLATIGGFVDREAAARTAEQQAKASGCASVTSPAAASINRALRCLARKDRTLPRARRGRMGTVTRRLRSEVNAARVWNVLRGSASGRRALAAFAVGRASFGVRSGNPSQATLRGN